MGKAISVAILTAALSLTALAAHAAGLGRITVHSPLGQPLNAEIEIVALAPGEEETLVARLAPPDAYAQAGIEATAILNTMRFAIERRDGRRVVRVTTQQAVNDPFVELLVELQWNTGRLVREYTFLLDPPEYRSRDLAAAAPKPVAPKPAVPITPPAAPAAEVKPPAPPAPAAEVKPAPVPEPITPTPAPSVETKPAAEITPPPVADAKPPAASVETRPLEPIKPEATKEEPPKPEPQKEAAAEPAKEPAKEEPAKPAVAEPKTHEVVKGDTLGAVAKANLPPGVTLNQMLIAIYRANQGAFIRENVNWVRAGRILHIPSADEIGSVDADEANRLVRTQMAQFREYRAKLAAVPASTEATPGQREPTGTIEPKPAAPKPEAPQDQVRLSKVDPQKPSASAAQAARGDDLVARERALKEAQSRITDLEKNVADLQKLLELRNQQLAELQKKAAEKPAAAPAKPEPAKPAPAPAPVAKAPEAPKPEAAKPEAPKPEAAKPEPPKPEAPKPEAPKPAPKPVAKPAPPPPERSLMDEVAEFVSEPMGMLVVLVLVLGLGGYGYWAWRKKKAAQAKFHDSVIGAAAAGAAASATMAEPTLPPASTTGTQPPPSGAPAAVAAEEVDPIAEADVYMAYGRDAQAEEILREALQKDANRTTVHAKLLEIYAKRKDTKAFEQTAVKLKSLTEGPEWEKAAALGRSIDPQNGLYAGAAGAVAAAAATEAAPSAPAAPAPTLDFDIGGAGQASASAPDLTLDAAPKAGDSGLDFDVSGATQTQKKDVSVDETVVASGQEKSASGGLDFNLDLGAPAAAPEEKKPEPAPAPAADPGLTFDLNLDLGMGDKKAEEKSAPAPDLSSISLDLGAPDTAAAPGAGADPKWQEIATKLDLAKAYEEMGDKNGARELLNEVMKDGDAAQKGQAQQLLAKLG